MSLMSDEIIGRARSLVGVKFRPQGRDPLTGLDCVGVILRATAIPDSLVRRDYRLRGAHSAEIESALSRWFFRLDSNQSCRGDIMLFGISSEQSHLGVNCGGSFIHADASLRRVVETPMPPLWPIAAQYRLRTSSKPD